MKWTISAIALVGLVFGVAIATGVHINTTASVPLGVYKEVREPISKGALVLVCPPDNELMSEARERGYIGSGMTCEGNYGHLIKRVVATHGDAIQQRHTHISVNGSELPNSAVLEHDPSGRPLRAYTNGALTLESGQVFLMADWGQSFDGRYFGPVDAQQIVAVLRPVITW